MLGIAEDKLRVVAPDVGGGFGAKLQVYGEEILASWRSRSRLGRPIKWVETPLGAHGHDATTAATRSTT